ncbi:hypothetical protein ACVTW2_000675 [Escherichia coli]
MGLFGGSSSASSTSTNNSYTWNSQQIEDFLNGMSTDVNYTNETFLDMNPYLQSFLDYETGGSEFRNAKNVMGRGEQVFSKGYNRLQNAASITPTQIYDALYQGVKGVNSSLQGYVSNEDSAIQNQVMASMGGELAQNAETMNAGGAVAGSSAMNNSAMGIQEAGAESMEKQESDLAMKVLRGSASAVNGLASGYARAESGITKSMMGIGANVMKAAAKMGNTAKSDYWNAALVEQAVAQKQANTSRKNEMINNNKGIMENMYYLETMLQAAGIDTTSTTTGSSSMSSGGLL